MPFPKQTTWVLVADGARARILAGDGRGQGLLPAMDRAFARKTRATRDLGTDKPGRAFESASPTRHAIEPRVDWHRFEKECFAREMADLLNRAAQARAFDRLVLVAPPQALGDLRVALDERTRALVVAEIHKDLTRHDARTITQQVREVVAAV